MAHIRQAAGCDSLVFVAGIVARQRVVVAPVEIEARRRILKDEHNMKQVGEAGKIQLSCEMEEAECAADNDLRCTRSRKFEA